MNTVTDAMYSLVKKYVARQYIVFDILKQLRPDFFMMDQVPIEELLHTVEIYSDVPQSGYWGNENQWEYFIHGGGCRLVHTQTKEPIDWNAPDPQIFDLFSFLKYLEWILDQNLEEHDVSIVKTAFQAQTKPMREFVFDTLDGLRQSGQLLQANGENANKLMLKQ